MVRDMRDSLGYTEGKSRTALGTQSETWGSLGYMG